MGWEREMFDPRPVLSEAVRTIEDSFGNRKPAAAIILGSGLDAVTEHGKPLAELPYSEIPGIPRPGVDGHIGLLKLVEFDDLALLCFCGRSHLYEDCPPYQLGMSVRIAAALGVSTIITTSAVGSLHKAHRPGCIIVVKDHINFTGMNPLIGIRLENPGDRFINTSGMYDTGLIEKALDIGKKTNLDIDTGIYAWITGPSFETPAESKMVQQFGANVIGMSMIPETITACQLGMRILAAACVTNYAPGIGEEPISHEDVLRQADLFSIPLKELLTGLRDYLQT